MTIFTLGNLPDEKDEQYKKYKAKRSITPETRIKSEFLEEEILAPRVDKDYLKKAMIPPKEKIQGALKGAYSKHNEKATPDFSEVVVLGVKSDESCMSEKFKKHLNIFRKSSDRISETLKAFAKIQGRRELDKNVVNLSDEIDGINLSIQEEGSNAENQQELQKKKIKLEKLHKRQLESIPSFSAIYPKAAEKLKDINKELKKQYEKDKSELEKKLESKKSDLSKLCTTKSKLENEIAKHLNQKDIEKDFDLIKSILERELTEQKSKLTSSQKDVHDKQQEALKALQDKINNHHDIQEIIELTNAYVVSNNSCIEKNEQNITEPEESVKTLREDIKKIQEEDIKKLLELEEKFTSLEKQIPEIEAKIEEQQKEYEQTKKLLKKTNRFIS